MTFYSRCPRFAQRLISDARGYYSPRSLRTFVSFFGGRPLPLVHWVSFQAGVSAASFVFFFFGKRLEVSAGGFLLRGCRQVLGGPRGRFSLDLGYRVLQSRLVGRGLVERSLSCNLRLESDLSRVLVFLRSWLGERGARGLRWVGREGLGRGLDILLRSLSCRRCVSWEGSCRPRWMQVNSFWKSREESRPLLVFFISEDMIYYIGRPLRKMGGHQRTPASSRCSQLAQVGMAGRIPPSGGPPPSSLTAPPHPSCPTQPFQLGFAGRKCKWRAGREWLGWGYDQINIQLLYQLVGNMSRMLQAESPLKFDTSWANLNCFVLPTPTAHPPASSTKPTKKIEFQDKAFLESVVCRILNDADCKDIHQLIDSMTFPAISPVEPEPTRDTRSEEIEQQAISRIFSHSSIHPYYRFDPTLHYSPDPNPAPHPYYYPTPYFHPRQQPPRKRRNPPSDQPQQFKIIPQKIESDGRTTLMIRHIPNKYSQQMLLEQTSRNHNLKINFLYLPIDHYNSCNVGYAFINFLGCRHILEFYREFSGRRWERFNSEKICELAYARIQGTANLMEHFQNAANGQLRGRVFRDDPKTQV